MDLLPTYDFTHLTRKALSIWEAVKRSVLQTPVFQNSKFHLKAWGFFCLFVLSLATNTTVFLEVLGSFSSFLRKQMSGV